MMPASREEELRARAEGARARAALHGPDIDVELLAEPPERGAVASLGELSPELQRAALSVGVDPAEVKRAGSLLLLDRSVVYDRVSRAYEGQVELLAIGEARARHAWLDDYWWRAIDVGSDRYTAAAYLAPTGGFFLHVKAGQRVFWPLQTCLLLEHQAARQILHNVILVEEDAEVQLVTGCTAHPGARRGMHVGVTEVYLQRGASLSETMIHHWAPGFHVRPRTAVVADAGASYVSNYVLATPALCVQSHAHVVLRGAHARAELRGIVVGVADSIVDLDVEVELLGRETRVDSVSRAIARDRSQIFVRGRLVGRDDRSQGHLDCRGMVVSNAAAIHAIPELDSEHAPHCRLSHEAAVGPIDEEVIDYLTTRGIDREEATSVLTRGFLKAGLPALPGPLEQQIHRLALLTATGAL